MSDKPVAWMIVQPGCEVGPVETMESTALRKAIDCPPGTAVVPLYARPEAEGTSQDALDAIDFENTVRDWEKNDRPIDSAWAAAVIRGFCAAPGRAGMSEAKAREVLKGEIQTDGGLYNGGWYVAWTPGEDTVTLDDHFTAEDLEAIAWWMRNYPPPQRQALTPKPTIFNTPSPNIAESKDE